MSTSDHSHSDRLLSAIVTSSNDAIIGKDLCGKITSWNKAAERLFGFTDVEMIGRSIMSIIPLQRRQEELSIIDRVRKGETLSHFETVRLTKKGNAVPVSLTVSPIIDDGGTVIGVSKIARDLSETQQLHRELRKREAMLQAILDTVPDGLIVIDPMGIIRFFSPAAEKIFKIPADEILGKNVRTLMPGPYAAVHDAQLKRYAETREKRIIGIGRVVAGKRSDGSTFPMELQIGEVSSFEEEVYIGFVRDLTDRQERDRRLAELQSELIHVSRVGEIAQMLSALTHEVNQPLTAMANYLNGISRLLTAEMPSSLRGAIDKTVEQCTRARDILKSLRGLVRKESSERRFESLETLIHETVAIAMIGAPKSIHIEINIEPDLPQAFINKVQIQQVFFNLMRNALEAMSATPHPNLQITVNSLNDKIVISIADNGPGLPETVSQRLFQPFVTTKLDGLGLGLSICRTIVEAHGGDLIAESIPGIGTTFRFSISTMDKTICGETFHDLR